MVRKLNGNADDWDVEAYKRRLRIMREIISGENQTDFAKRLGVDYKRWSNYERGYPVPREVAFMLRKQWPGMSIEWLWFGSPNSLSAEYKDKIKIAEQMDIEAQRDIDAMTELKRKLDLSAEKRRKVLHPNVAKPSKGRKTA